MDSPGYIVEQFQGKKIKLIKLGSPAFPSDSVEVALKTRSGKYPLRMYKELNDDGVELYFTSMVTDGAHGDRVCFRGEPRIDDGIIHAPFLDNRLGCHVLCRVAEEWDTVLDLPVNLLLGATALEEVGCIGAPVLARAIQPDLAICVDATYANPAQSVNIGGGPVLTISDASVVVSPRDRDRLLSLFSSNGIPLQTEVYNFSGTDAKGFPAVGLSTSVLALLLATTGNHSPQETAATTDIEHLLKGIYMIVNAVAANDWPLP